MPDQCRADSAASCRRYCKTDVRLILQTTNFTQAGKQIVLDPIGKKALFIVAQFSTSTAIDLLSDVAADALMAPPSRDEILPPVPR